MVYIYIYVIIVKAIGLKMQVPTLPHTRRLQTGHLEMLQTFSTSAACHTKSCAFVRDGRLWLQNLLATLWTSNTSCITIEPKHNCCHFLPFPIPCAKHCLSNRFQTFRVFIVHLPSGIVRTAKFPIRHQLSSWLVQVFHQGIPGRNRDFDLGYSIHHLPSTMLASGTLTRNQS